MINEINDKRDKQNKRDNKHEFDMQEKKLSKEKKKLGKAKFLSFDTKIALILLKQAFIIVFILYYFKFK